MLSLWKNACGVVVLASPEGPHSAGCDFCAMASTPPRDTAIVEVIRFFQIAGGVDILEVMRFGTLLAALRSALRFTSGGPDSFCLRAKTVL